MEYRTERPSRCASRGWSVAVLLALGCSLGQVAEAQVLEAQGGVKNRYQISRRAADIHARGYVFDGHNDLPWEVRTKATRGFDELDISKPQASLHTDIDRLRVGNVGAQFWSVFVPDFFFAGRHWSKRLFAVVDCHHHNFVHKSLET